jgi:tetratricopeptide (TPR) repeat protein
MHKAIKAGKDVVDSGKDLVAKSEKAITEFRQLIAYKQSLDKMGINSQMLVELIDAIAKYGDFDTMVDSINAIGNLQAIQSAINKAQVARQDLEATVESLTSQIKELQDNKRIIEEPIRLYKELETEGFNRSALERIRESSEKFGDPRQVLDAINRYADVKELAEAIKEEKKNAEAVQVERTKLDADYAHLAQVIAICDKLLQMGFSVSAIQQIHDIASKHGEPLEILKAIDAYGKLHDLEAEIQNASMTRASLRTQVDELQQNLVTLTAQTSAVGGVVQQSLDSMKARLSTAAEEVSNDLASTFKEEATKLAKIKNEYAETLRTAAVLEEEIKLARIIQSILRYPADIQVSPHYATLFLDLSVKVLRAKGVNPKVGDTGLTILELLTVAENQLATTPG